MLVVPLSFLDGHTRRIVRSSLVRRINQNMTHISEYHLGVLSITSTICVNACIPAEKISARTHVLHLGLLWIYLEIPLLLSHTCHSILFNCKQFRFAGFNIILNFHPALHPREVFLLARPVLAVVSLLQRKTASDESESNDSRCSCARLTSCQMSHHMTEASNLILLK